MKITVDLTSHVPIYTQIVDQIKHMIATNELKPGDQLPTVRQLAADLRVNFNTIARSYRLLDEDRIISTQRGRGTYILELPTEENGEKLRREGLMALTRHYLTEAHRLGYSPEEVKAVFEPKLDIWAKEGSPPSPRK